MSRFRNYLAAGLIAASSLGTSYGLGSGYMANKKNTNDTNSVDRTETVPVNNDAITIILNNGVIVKSNIVQKVQENAKSKETKKSSGLPTLEGVIRDVREIQIPAWCGTGNASSIPATRVIVFNDGKFYDLILTCSKGVPRNVRARIAYEPTQNGRVNMKYLLNRTFLSEKKYTVGNDNPETPFYADGLILSPKDIEILGVLE